MCLPSACHHQKSNCMMIRVCFGNNQISPVDVAQLGRQVVQISKTAHPIAKLVKPMCLPCACNHQKSNHLMIRVCLPNFTHRCRYYVMRWNLQHKYLIRFEFRFKANTAFTLRQLNRARPARFHNRAGSRLHWSYVTVLELLTRRRRLTQTNHAVEQWRARGPAKKLCTASSCLFSVYSIVAFF